MAALFVAREDASSLYSGLTSGWGAVCVVASMVAGLTTFAVIVGGKTRNARWSSAAAVGALVAGWAFAQSPYLLPGELTLDEAAAPDATLTALIVAVAFGAVLLVPSLIWLYKLVLRGDLQHEYRPIDEDLRDGKGAER